MRLGKFLLFLWHIKNLDPNLYSIKCPALHRALNGSGRPHYIGLYYGADLS